MKCKNCGKEHDGSYGSGKFCCSSCRVSFTNKQRGKHSKETIEKISNTIKAKLKQGYCIRNNQYTNNTNIYKPISLYELVSQNIICNPCNYSIKDKNFDYNKIVDLRYCPYCNKEYYGYITKHGNLSIKFCSEECSKNSMKLKLSNKVQERINDGTFSGWKTRNVSSYAEKFWEDVLNNNNISYEREYVVEIDKTKRYFIDFLLKIKNKRIDLEIDGKQHTYDDRKEHDIIRDDILKNKGYIVYRISWNEIHSKKGKAEMKNKIENFLLFVKDI